MWACAWLQSCKARNLSRGDKNCSSHVSWVHFPSSLTNFDCVIHHATFLHQTDNVTIMSKPHELPELIRKNSSSSLPFCSSTTSNNSLSRAPQPSSAVSDINSPLIQEDGDNKVLKLRFDVSQYTPEEIVVKTVDNKLMVSRKVN